MKRIYFYALIIALSSMTFISCEKPPVKPIDNTIVEGGHFDVWTPVGGLTGMGDNNYIVKSVTSLDSGELNYQGSGVDLSEKLFPHTIIKGKYYYQLTKEGRFGKYQISENQLVVIKEFPFTILKERRYTHAWIDKATLLLIGSNGASDKMLWVKVNTETMQEIANGEITLPAPPTGQIYNTSGLASYRREDNKVLYSFKYNKATTGGTTPAPEFYMAFINPTDMSVEKIVTENRAEMMSSTAYGELRQSKTFFDENGDYYIACSSVLPGEGTTTAQRGYIFRVKKGETEFDKTYSGYKEARGKIITMNYLNNGKAILYMQDPMYATNNKTWNSKTNPYVFYWIILDLKTQNITYLKDIPFGQGSFSELAVVTDKKAYVGMNTKDSKVCIYQYDIASGKLTKGMTLAEGYPLERIVWIKD